MARTYYCASCLNSFQTDGATCPNLACGAARPDGGWGRLLGEGDLLDRRYRVRRRLAVGGAGITYLARELDDDDDLIGPELAIKVLFHRGDGTWLKRLANEARVLQELAHPHIVESRGFVQRTGHPAYLVTVYEPGGNLFDHVREAGSLSVEASLGIFEQVLEALAMAHRRGVVHRDLKPQNIFLRDRPARDVAPHVLVADFGIAKLQGFLGEHLTTAGTFVGTPEFAAPEQFKGLPPEPPSDVFAATCVFWFCLTGAPPVPFADRRDLVASLRKLRDTLPPSLPPSIGTAAQRAALDDLFAHTLVFDPKARWTLPALLDTLAQLGTPTTPLDFGPMATLTPDALMFDEEEDDDDAEPSPTPPPPPEPPVVVAPPKPEPAPPPKPEPTPPPKPEGRVRLGKHEDRRPAPQPARPRVIDDGLDALFDTPADDGVVHIGSETSPDLSLDDLFGAAPAPEPRPEPSAPQAPVVEAFWETVAEPASPGVQPVETAPDPAQEPEPEPEPPLHPWAAATPVDVGTPETDAERLVALARCSHDARATLIEAFDNGPGAAAVPTSAGREQLIGAALLVQHHGIASKALWCRQLLGHAEPDVRATAALALGTVGATGQLALINRLLEDGDARVRVAAVFALRALGERTGRESLVVDWLKRVADDADPRVRRAVRG